MAEKEYIEREAAIDAMCHVCVVEKDRQSCAYAKGKYGGCDVMDGIKQVPAVDARPMAVGKWVYDHWCEFKCSNCGARSKSEPYRGRENFCPNCGADMRGGGNENA